MEMKYIKRKAGYQIEVNGEVVAYAYKYYGEWVVCTGANMFGQTIGYARTRKEAVADAMKHFQK